jgi:predicted small secreted protein
LWHLIGGKKESVMKNTMKFLGIIALVAVIGFTMAACPGDDGGGGDDTPKFEPITRIPDNYLNTTWSFDRISCSVTFGSDAGKFSFYKINQGTSSHTVSPLSDRKQMEGGFDSGLLFSPNAFANHDKIFFKTDGSKLNMLGLSDWVKK